MSNHPTILEIDKEAVKNNLQYFRSKIKDSTKILVVVKAFAYGSDSLLITKILEQQKVDYLAVAYTDEGVALRKENISLPILVLHPQIENFDKIISYKLEPNLYNFRTLNSFILAAEKAGITNYPVHIKINSGMNRLGFKEDEISSLRSELQNINSLKIISFYSHFAASEDLNEIEFSKQQIVYFERACRVLNQVLPNKPFMHISNTSGIINYPEAQFDMVRLGIGLYGFGNNKKETSQLKNVCNLKTKISQIQYISKGETVSYNRKFIAKKHTKIGVIPLGYADGLKRNLGNGIGFVYIKNQKVPIVGTVCMDITLIDVTELNCKGGDEVVIFNHQDHILAFAEKTSSIPYEILTSISQRVRRKLI